MPIVRPAKGGIPIRAQRNKKKPSFVKRGWRKAPGDLTEKKPPAGHFKCSRIFKCATNLAGDFTIAPTTQPQNFCATIQNLRRRDVHCTSAASVKQRTAKRHDVGIVPYASCGTSTSHRGIIVAGSPRKDGSPDPSAREAVSDPREAQQETASHTS